MSGENKEFKYGQLVEIAFLALLVVVARMLIENMLPIFSEWAGETFFVALRTLLRNYPLTLLMLIGDFALIKILVKNYSYGESFMKRTMLELSGVIFIAVVSAVLMQLSAEQVAGTTLNARIFLTFVVSFVLNIIIAVMIDIFSYTRWKRKTAIDEEVKLRRQANYQYQLLKGQLNPHFLFNSLNVLDYLIYKDQDRASGYVKKLANVYRYQLNIESHPTVTLEEEIEFVTMYVGLIKERFTDAVVVNVNISDEYLKRKIVPCGLQLLIENAVKHNVASIRQPLCINVFIEDEFVAVSNLVNLKIHTNATSGVGLENINRQYQILFHSNIVVEKDENYFKVKIPLFV